MNTKIEFDRLGRVTSGPDKGKYLRIERCGDKAFYIFWSEDETPKLRYDDWVEDLVSLKEYFAHKRLEIEWI